MFSLFFLILGGFLGWWLRGTKAGSWISRQFSSSNEPIA